MGVKYYGVPAGKFRRYHSSKILNIIDPTTIVKNGTDFFHFIKGILRARNVLMHEKPDVLFAKGGYVSLPVGLAARSLKIPIVIHESDVVMGLANRKLARYSEKVCVAFPEKNYPYIEKEKLFETGNPIREDILMGKGDVLRTELGFSNSVKTILVLGGSQGSQYINEKIFEIIEKIAAKYQLIWIAGDKDADLINYRLKELPKEVSSRVAVYGFVTSEMADVYAASDLMISRSGSSVLFEAAALALPTILIPHDVSPGGHQLENAKLFSRSGAASLFKQENLTAKNLYHQIEHLLEDEDELKSMSNNMKKWADIGSAEKVANIVYKTGEKSIEQSREASK